MEIRLQKNDEHIKLHVLFKVGEEQYLQPVDVYIRAFPVSIRFYREETPYRSTR